MQENIQPKWAQEDLATIQRRWTAMVDARCVHGEDAGLVNALAGKIRGFGLRYDRAVLALAATKVVTQLCREMDEELASGRLILTEDKNRCEVCGWPLAASASEGCVPGNCSYRPPEGTDEYRRIQQRREALKKSGS